MIDIYNCTDYERNQRDLEEFWIFAICVAGKNAKVASQKVHSLLHPLGWQTPVGKLKRYMGEGKLATVVKQNKLGQYKRITGAFIDTIRAQDEYGEDFLRKATVEQLESIHGVGPKTARYFLIHTRPDQRLAALDTHILKFLREQRYDAPKLTPSGKTYKRLEDTFLELADKSGMPLAEFDLALWRYYSTKPKGVALNVPISTDHEEVDFAD